jgi:XTP/dITP diphosphohydrolase
LPPKVLLATTNRHKAREIAAILSLLGIETEVAAALPAVVEDGATFLENATKKAASAAAALRRIAIADDSGLEVAALSGAPGVHSARYAGPAATDAQNVEKLLLECAARGLVDPKAAFICAAVCCDAEGNVLASAEGRVEGVVRAPPRGRFGFGYDPVFHHVGPLHPAPGVRFADLTPAAKDVISHRGIAFRALAALLLYGAGR